jgi:hypothetical protein
MSDDSITDWEARFDRAAHGSMLPSPDDIVRVRNNVRAGWAIGQERDLMVVAAALGALAREIARNNPPDGPAFRGTPARPCEYCTNIETGATRCHRGFYRCNTCGEPSQ